MPLTASLMGSFQPIRKWQYINNGMKNITAGWHTNADAGITTK